MKTLKDSAGKRPVSRVGIAADHGGFALKERLGAHLSGQGYELIDFGAFNNDRGDDFPDFVVPMARAVAAGRVDRGIAVCASGVGASIAANKIAGARAALIEDDFSARQGVEDDDMNILCLGSKVTGYERARELAGIFLDARFSGEERFRRRLAKIAGLEREGERAMKENPLQRLTAVGQAIWLDYLQRSLITSGRLGRLIEEDALRGMTSNPSIFEKAIDGSGDYDSDIRSKVLAGKNVREIYEELAVADVQMAADAFRPVYERLGGRDGFVSLEVNPHLAHDTRGSVEEARRLWKKVGRPNCFIKIPATAEGLPAIAQCLGEEININITLLFGLPRYREVVDAYLGGMETLMESGAQLKGVSSVASFFLSRIDVIVDPVLEAKAGEGGRTAELARSLLGQTAIASARLAYQIYKEIFSSPRFKSLEAKGAHSQRVLWASTSTKNPAYSDIKYVEPLIGADTINTVPIETLDAYRDHGNPTARIENGLDEARGLMDRLPELGIDIDAVTQRLEDEGVAKFSEAHDRLMASLERKCEAIRKRSRVQ